jgi:hypothetical protein
VGDALLDAQDDYDEKKMKERIRQLNHYLASLQE